MGCACYFQSPCIWVIDKNDFHLAVFVLYLIYQVHVLGIVHNRIDCHYNVFWYLLLPITQSGTGVPDGADTSHPGRMLTPSRARPKSG
jgi:hypothetical protein